MSYALGLSPQHEFVGSQNVDYRNIFDIVVTVISVLINTSILYLLGYLLTKAYKYFSANRN